MRIVLGAVASRPLEADRAAALLKGEALTDEAIAAAAAAASEVAKPMDNTDFELVWRKKMVRSLVANALHEDSRRRHERDAASWPGRSCCRSPAPDHRARLSGAEPWCLTNRAYRDDQEHVQNYT